MSTKNVVVVGAGFSGVVAARKLAKKLKGTEYKIVLIDKHSFMTYMTELHEVATGRVEPQHVQNDLRTLFHPFKNVELLTTEVKSIDKEKKVVETADGSIPYEKLVLATGGTTNTFGTPGVYEYGYTLWSYEEAVRLRGHIEEVIREGALELDPVKRAAKLQIVVVGSGFTGSELTGELMDQRHELALANNLDESEIKIKMVEAAPTILNMLNRKLADKAEAHFTAHGIEVMKSTGVVEVKEKAAVLKDGSEIPTETLIWTAGVKAKEQGQQWGLDLGPGQRFMVDEHSRVQGEEDIYAIGDVAAYQNPELADPENPRAGWTPQTVEGGESSANTAVPNLVHELTGKGAPKKFKGRYQGYAVSIGARYAVAVWQQLGDKKIGKNGIGMSGFFANAFKHIINIYWFLQIKSWYYLGHYLRDEIFETPDGRNPFFGWTSRQGNVLFALPLRLVLGMIWMSVGQSAALSGTWMSMVALIIGWLIFFGMFTSMAGFIGIILSIGMIMSGNATGDIVYFLLPAASFAIMNGSGRVLGVDFWLMPAVERFANRVLHGKRSSRYNDYK